MKNEFVRGCKSWFVIDGGHLKGPFGGVLLFFVRLDGNKGMFPVAFAVVEIEIQQKVCDMFSIVLLQCYFVKCLLIIFLCVAGSFPNCSKIFFICKTKVKFKYNRVN